MKMPTTHLLLILAMELMIMSILLPPSPLQVSALAPFRTNVRLVNGSFAATFPLGTPPQPQELALSFTAAISTVRCGGRAPAFEPSRSSTFRRRRRRAFFDDTIRLNRSNGKPPATAAAARHVAFRCGGAAEAALGAGQLALPAQLAARSGGATSRPAFAYCLPGGPLFLGGSGDHGYFVRGGPDGSFRNLSGLFSHAPIRVTKRGGAAGPYSVSVTGVTVGARAVDVAAPFRLHVSAAVRYARLERRLYRRLRSAFRASIAFGTSATPALPPSGPLDTCFNATKFGSSRVGPAVPEIDLHLSGGATWQIFGRNSVVPVADGVLCWAFVDAGANAPSVLGTFQQEENLVELDLAASRLSFTGILYFYQTTCENFG